MDYLTLRYLYHSGVKGQKWGVRRYQNADGTLTPEGRAHYGLRDLDYNARYSGQREEGIKAIKKEYKDIMKPVNKAYAKETNLVASGREYKAGVKEVEKYLNSKYGDEIFNEFTRSKKQKAYVQAGAMITAGAIVSIAALSIPAITKYKNDKEQLNAEEQFHNNYVKNHEEKMNKLNENLKKDDKEIEGLLGTAYSVINAARNKNKDTKSSSNNVSGNLDLNGNPINKNRENKYSNVRDAAENLRKSTRDTADTYGRVADKAEDLEKLAKKFRNQVDNF